MFGYEDEKEITILKKKKKKSRQCKALMSPMTSNQHWRIKVHAWIIITFDWGVSEPANSIRAWSLMYAGALKNTE